MTEPTGQNAWTRAYLLVGLCVLGLGLYTLGEPFGRDQGIHATIAYAWQEGLTPYKDVYNIKPPLTTLMHRLSQMAFGSNTQAIRVLDLGIVVLAVLGLMRALQRLDRPMAEAALTGVSFGLIYYALTYWEHAQTDEWAGFMVIPSLLCLQKGWDRTGPSRFSWILLAGAALGIGVAFKYTIAAAGLLVFAPLMGGGPALRFRIADLWAYVLGGALVLGSIAAILAMADALFPFLEIQTFLGGYIAYASQNPSVLRQITVLFSPSPLLGWLALLGLLPWLAALIRGESLFLWVTAIWGATAFLSGYAQGKGFAYHFMPLIPVYAILCGLFLSALYGALSRRLVSPPIARALIGLTLIAALITTPIAPRSLRSLSLWLKKAPLTQFHALYPMPPDFDIDAINTFAARLATHRAPGDSLFIWGYETMLYLLAKEPPRYRYAYAWPFVVDFHDGRYTQDLLDRLNATPPKHIVIQDKDATPWVTGRPQSSARFLDLFPQLNTFINENYQEIDKTDRFRLMQRHP